MGEGDEGRGDGKEESGKRGDGWRSGGVGRSGKREGEVGLRSRERKGGCLQYSGENILKHTFPSG